jgi:hypothetical protein
MSVALVIQRAGHMRHIILPSAARFSENVTEHNTRVFIYFTTLSETFLIPRRIRRYITNVISLHVKFPFFLSDFNKMAINSTDFRKVLKY